MKILKSSTIDYLDPGQAGSQLQGEYAETENQTTSNLELPVNLTWTVRRNPSTQRKPRRRGDLRQIQNPETSCCQAALPSAAPPWHPQKSIL